MMIACTTPSQKTKPSQESTDSVDKKEMVKTDSSKSSLQDRLCNGWTEVGDEVTIMQFDKDSVYYVDEDPSMGYSYTLKGDKLTIHLGDQDIVRKISFHKDTLLMENESGEVGRLLPVK